MAGPTDQEQLQLEYLNFARMDPLGEAAQYISSYSPLTSSDPDIQGAFQYFQVDGTALQQAFATLTPVQPVAWNDNLASAARTHDQAMITAQSQSHQEAGEADLGTRITAAGYAGWTAVGENIYAYSEDPLFAQAGFMVDWGPGPGGMQSPAGHRENIMNGTYNEVGIGIVAGSGQVGPEVETEDFGKRSSTQSFVTGVAFTDRDNNDFYSVGEGRSDLVVSDSSGSVTSWSSGGFTLAKTNAATSVSLTGGGLSGAVTVGLPASANNVELDVVNGNELKVNGTASVGGPVSRIEGVGQGLNLTVTDSLAHTLVGTGYNDVFTPGSGATAIQGGGGTDTAILPALYRASGANLTNGTGTVSVNGVTDTLSSIENVAFEDGTLTFDPNSPAAQVMRLYDAVLNRTPDAVGSDNWVQLLQSGTSLESVAAAFVNSSEFQADTGGLSNTGFVDYLYQHALGRTADASGEANWVGLLNSGTSRANVVLAFSESQEHETLTAPELAKGLFETDSTDQAVAALYDSAFNREPDPTGLVSWVSGIRSGAETLAQVANAFASSKEFQADTAGKTNTQLVDFMYENTLKRAPDPAGEANFVQALNNGASLGSLLLSFSQSQEHHTLIAANLSPGIGLQS